MKKFLDMFQDELLQYLILLSEDNLLSGSVTTCKCDY
jgi:hypothetical protein